MLCQLARPSDVLLLHIHLPHKHVFVLALRFSFRTGELGFYFILLRVSRSCVLPFFIFCAAGTSEYVMAAGWNSGRLVPGFCLFVCKPPRPEWSAGTKLIGGRALSGTHVWCAGAMDLDLNRRIPCVGGGGVAYFNFAAALTLCIGGTGGTTDRQTDKQLGGGGGGGGRRELFVTWVSRRPRRKS